MGLKSRLTAAFLIILSTLSPGCAAGRVPRPLVVHGSVTTVEIAPVLLAADEHFSAGAVVRNGGIPNLVGLAPPAGLGGGVADLATHAETQALRYSVAHPDIRIILTVTEGRYRIVARRSAGIARLADLRGKRIATIPTTSAGYFLARMLATAAMSFDDVEVVRVSPIENMAKALERREIDAVAIWEPFSDNGARAIGSDLIEFGGEGVYRELFNLNTTAGKLADPVERPRIVRFVRAVIDAAAALRADPAAARRLVVATSGFTPDEVARAWPHLAFPASVPDDLLDVLVEEEKWLAGRDGRAPRSRETLARLIDRSVYDEARALR